MKADFSRLTFDPARHYSGVWMQQGRVQVDADSNEQATIARRRVELEAADLIGGCGGPIGAAGFEMVLDVAALSATQKAELAQRFAATFTVPAGDFLIGPGRFYVDGILTENDGYELYSAQRDLPGLLKLIPSTAGSYTVYLDVWDRHLTALDDARLRETALGGPDTATRTRTTWQVRTVAEGAVPVNCVDDPAEYLKAIAPSTGTLQARAVPEAPTDDDCIVPASAGYRGLENQLYRVEVASGGSAVDLPGTGHTSITAGSTAEKIVYDTGAWSVGQAVEIYRPGADAMAGDLAIVVAKDAPSKTLTLNIPVALDPAQSPRMRPVGATFLWSRDNGSVVGLITKVDGRKLELQDLDNDEVLGFKEGQWVTISDDARELRGEAPELARIEAKSGTTVTLTAAPAFPGNLASVPLDRHLKLRRWDGVGAVKTDPPTPNEGYIDLEDGVQVRFGLGTYKPGDYWLIPARTANADARSGHIEWQVEDETTPGSPPAALAPFGIRHAYCRLGIVRSDGTKLTYEDCRPIFPPATELTSLRYVGGDGQEAMPGAPLPKLLEVAVFNGEHPVVGARVKFSTLDGGTLTADPSLGAGAPFPPRTNVEGIARAAWTLDPPVAKPSQQTEARLLDAAGNETSQVIRFTANHSIASNVAFTASDDCTDLKPAKTVAEALELLCARHDEGDCCEVTVGPEEKLGKVITDLVARGNRAFCICLKAGDYELANLVLNGDHGSFDAISIRGCGPQTRLHLAKPLRARGLGSLRLIDLTIVAKHDSRAVWISECDEAIIRGCSIVSKQGVGLEIGAFDLIRIEDTSIEVFGGPRTDHLTIIKDLLEREGIGDFLRRARELAGRLAAVPGEARDLGKAVLEHNTDLSYEERASYQTLGEVLLEGELREREIVAAFVRVRDAAITATAGIGLIIEDGVAETWLENDRIPGIVCLYGPPSTESSGINFVALLRTMAAAGQLPAVPPRGADLHLRDNRLGRLGVGKDVMAQLANGGGDDRNFKYPLYRSALLSGNAIESGSNILVASKIALASTQFAGGEDLGVLVSDSVSVVGNIAPSPGATLISIARITEAVANPNLTVVS